MSGFYGDYALQLMKNSGNDNYVTLINKSGEWLFEPIKCGQNEVDEGVYCKKFEQFIISGEGSNLYLIGTNGVIDKTACSATIRNVFTSFIDGKEVVFYTHYNEKNLHKWTINA